MSYVTWNCTFISIYDIVQWLDEYIVNPSYNGSSIRRNSPYNGTSLYNENSFIMEKSIGTKRFHYKEVLLYRVVYYRLFPPTYLVEECDGTGLTLQDHVMFNMWHSLRKGTVKQFYFKIRFNQFNSMKHVYRHRIEISSSPGFYRTQYTFLKI